MNEDLTQNLDEWIVSVGRVVSHWSRADLKIQSFSPVETRFAKGSVVAVDWQGGKRLLTIGTSRAQGHAFICDCGLTAEEAQALKGAQLWIHPQMRPPLPEGEFYFDQLLGVRVRSESGQDLGVIEEIMESKAHPIYVTEKAMIPGVPEIIISTDFVERLLVVRDDSFSEM